MRKLIINTADNKKISVGVQIDNASFQELVSDSTILRSEAALPLIEKILKENGLSIKDLNAIEVFEGPGSFTGLRVGISIANALGFLLNIPVNGRKIGDLAGPVYN